MSVRRNTFYNLGGSLTPIAVMLITVPIYLNLIGEERYGILAIAWVLLGYFGLFDLGLSRATAHRIATLKDGSAEERSEVFWTALLLNAGFGILGALLLLPLGYLFFSNYFQLPDVLRPEAIAIVPWLAAAVPVATVSGVLSGALQGREQFLALNIISMCGTVLFQVLPLVVAWVFGPNLFWLIPAALLGRILTFSALFQYCRRYIPIKGWPRVSRKLIKPLFAYGGWISVTAIVGPLMVTLDRFLIGAVAGAKAVTWYTVPYHLVQRGTILPASVSNALFPRFASAQSQQETNRLAEESTRALVVVMTPVIVAGILIMEPFLAWWLSVEFANQAADVGHIIALGLWANALARIPITLLQGGGRPDLPAKCHLGELVPYLAFLAMALQWWGIVGVAVAWSLRVTADALFLFGFSRYRPNLYTILIPLLLLTIASTSVFALPLYDLTRWLLGLGALLSAAIWGWFTAPASLKALVPFFPSHIRLSET